MRSKTLLALLLGGLFFLLAGCGSSSIGSITEFTLQTPKSQPRALLSGPDGNLWFTEFEGNKIGYITTGK
jgi:virginiamycin B lyase